MYKSKVGSYENKQEMCSTFVRTFLEQFTPKRLHINAERNATRSFTVLTLMEKNLKFTKPI